MLKIPPVTKLISAIELLIVTNGLMFSVSFCPEVITLSIFHQIISWFFFQAMHSCQNNYWRLDIEAYVLIHKHNIAS